MDRHGSLTNGGLRSGFILVIQAVLVIAVCCEAIAETPPATPKQPQELPGLIDEVQRSVVNVHAYQTIPKGLAVNTLNFLNPFPLRTFLKDTLLFAYYIPRAIVYPVPSHRLGSGFFIDAAGHVATNFHVVRNYNVFKVQLVDGSVHEAEVIAKDPFADLAILEVDVTGLEDTIAPVITADSDNVQSGDFVLVVGNPLGLTNSANTGIVSGVGRRVGATRLDDMIQIDAALDPGNSGGPVFDADGKVIGIAAAHIFLAENKGFAIPINMLTSQLQNMIRYGEPRRSRIGVTIQNLTTLQARTRGLEQPRGSLIVEVEDDSPADRAGLNPGDVVLEYDGKKIEDSLQLVRYVRRTPPGNTVQVKILPANSSLKPVRVEKEEASTQTLSIQPVLITAEFQIF